MVISQDGHTFLHFTSHCSFRMHTHIDLAVDHRVLAAFGSLSSFPFSQLLLALNHNILLF